MRTYSNISDDELVYWCDECDLVEVSSHNKSTGMFFVQFGDQESGYGEYTCISYALCRECIKSRAQELLELLGDKS